MNKLVNKQVEPSRLSQGVPLSLSPAAILSSLDPQPCCAAFDHVVVGVAVAEKFPDGRIK